MGDVDAARAFLETLKAEARSVKARIAYRLDSRTKLFVEYKPPQFERDLKHAIPSMLWAFELWRKAWHDAEPHADRDVRGSHTITEADALRLLQGEAWESIEASKEPGSALFARIAEAHGRRAGGGLR